jgi:hypothetical protein
LTRWEFHDAVLWNAYNYERLEEFVIPPGAGVNLVDAGINDVASGNSWVTSDFGTNSTCPGPSPFG